MCETQNNKKTNVSKQHGIVLVMIKGWKYVSSDLRAKKIIYINISQSGWYCPPGGIASILGDVMQKWAVEGQQCSSCSCYHESRIT